MSALETNSSSATADRQTIDFFRGSRMRKNSCMIYCCWAISGPSFFAAAQASPGRKEKIQQELVT